MVALIIFTNEQATKLPTVELMQNLSIENFPMLGGMKRTSALS